MKKQVLTCISVVVATKNEEKNIAHCLESLKHQSCPGEKIELIVIDNDSSDKTREIAARFTKKIFNLPKLVGLKDVKNYRGAQINFGVRKSKGGIVFFPDADMTFDKDLLKEAENLLSEGKFEALYSPEEVIGSGFFGKIRNFERSFYNQTCIDVPRILRKKTYLNAGGFDEKNISFGPDDWDFAKMTKLVTKKVGITASRIFHHEEDKNIKSHLKKKKQYLITFADYIKKWGKADSDIKKQFSFRYRYFTVFVEGGKWRKLISHPFLMLGMYFLRIGVGIVYLKKKFGKND